MKKLWKQLSVLIMAVMLLMLVLPISADNAGIRSDAEIVGDLGLMEAGSAGITAKYLAAQPDRLQGAIMLLKFLGRLEEARSYIPSKGFKNYDDAAGLQREDAAVLAYLKANPDIGFDDVGNNKFAPGQKLTEAQYYRILLIALGCAEGSTGDFSKAALDAFASGKEVIVATDRSTAEWKKKAGIICTRGEIPRALRTALKLGHGIFKFAPGEYLIEGASRWLWIGSDTKITGAIEIKQPAGLGDMLYPNSSLQAVFITRTALPSTQQSNDSQTGIIRTVAGAQNVTISNIVLSGYTSLKLDNASKCRVSNVLIHNYRGIYPKGQWCNMGYGRATGSLWLFGNCNDIDIINCQIQCSSHHGLTIHTGSNQFISKNIRIKGCRALYCGNGQLRGESAGEEKDAEIRVPETKGYGYRDWSVAYDLCENQSVENVTVEDCYALEGWKCGFYTEPESSGGYIKNLVLKRCRSDLAGQRAVIKGSNPKATIPSETEGSNFYMQGGYFEDCISVQGEKCGWYLNPDRRAANNSGSAKMKLIRCGDMGSPISMVTEMTDSSNLYSDGFWSLNATGHAMWLFGSTDFKLLNTVILSSNKSNSPIKIGYMLRQQLRESRNPQNQKLVVAGGKYDVLRAQLTNSMITATVYNLPDQVGAVEIVKGATFNGSGNPSDAGNGITIKRQKDSKIKTSDYVKTIISKPAPVEESQKPKVFTNNDMAAATIKALKMDIKDGTKTLITKLVVLGSVPEASAIASNIYVAKGMDRTASYRSNDLKGDWQKFGYYLGTGTNGRQKVEFDVIPAQSKIDGTIGFAGSAEEITGINSLAMLVRLSPQGCFEVSNGGTGLQKTAVVSYAADTRYHVEIFADMDLKKYSVSVTPYGGQTTEIARDYVFQPGAGMQDEVGRVFFVTDGGSCLLKVQNFSAGTY